MIRGSKVVLRPFSEGFSEEELRIQFRWSQDRDVVRWSNMAPSTLTFAEFAEQFRVHNHSNGTDRELFAILTADQGSLIGRIGCFNINRETRQAELGVVIGEKDYWSRGYGRDAVCALLGYVFKQTSLQRVYLYTLAENARARRSFASCGFKEMATHKRFSFEGGEYEDVKMEITRREWLVGK
jgi:RimJ/RimL family protein N-acetyltransferase